MYTVRLGDYSHRLLPLLHITITMASEIVIISCTFAYSIEFYRFYLKKIFQVGVKFYVCQTFFCEILITHLFNQKKKKNPSVFIPFSGSL